MINDTKVIGYLTERSPQELYCGGPSLVIAGSEARMKNMLSLAGVTNAKDYSIRKVRFGDVIAGMELGASYSFDEKTYGRFGPFAYLAWRVRV